MKDIFKKIISTIILAEAKLIIKKYKPKVIAVTGTVGKTSTKDAIYTVLSSTEHVRKSHKSFNSEIGVPLTILGCPNGWNDPFVWLKNIFVGIDLILFRTNYPKCLVLEVGADHPGDIKSFAQWLKTDVAVITKVGDVPVHVEFFPSPEAVLKEKAYLINSLKDDGTLVLISDDKKVSDLAKDVKQKVMTFGISQFATVMASDIQIIYDDNKMPKGMFFNLNFKENKIPTRIDGVIGNQHIYPLIAASAVGIAYGVPIDAISKSIENHIPPRGRMNILKGINDCTIIDDTYNSSPDALREALSVLANLQVSGKRIAVLGDMLELGQFSIDEHRKAGVQAMQSCDLLITVGHRAKDMNLNALNFDSSYEAGEYLKGIVGPGDVVLVKGSQSIRMERVSKVLLADPQMAEELLVRQEEEWLLKK